MISLVAYRPPSGREHTVPFGHWMPLNGTKLLHGRILSPVFWLQVGTCGTRSTRIVADRGVAQIRVKTCSRKLRQVGPGQGLAEQSALHEELSNGQGFEAALLGSTRLYLNNWLGRGLGMCKYGLIGDQV